MNSQKHPKTIKRFINKTVLTAVSSILLLTLFTNCGNAQKKVAEESISFEEKTPFTIKKSYYQNIVGGIPGSSETHLVIEIISKSTTKIVFDSVYFNQKIQPINVFVSGEKQLITGTFFNNSSVKKDLIMDADPKKEMANKVLPIHSKIPFKLNDNECVISYYIDGEKKFYKLKNIKKGKTVYRQ